MLFSFITNSCVYSARCTYARMDRHCFYLDIIIIIIWSNQKHSNYDVGAREILLKDDISREAAAI